MLSLDLDPNSDGQSADTASEHFTGGVQMAALHFRLLSRKPSLFLFRKANHCDSRPEVIQESLSESHGFCLESYTCDSGTLPCMNRTDDEPGVFQKKGRFPLPYGKKAEATRKSKLLRSYVVM